MVRHLQYERKISNKVSGIQDILKLEKFTVPSCVTVERKIDFKEMIIFKKEKVIEKRKIFLAFFFFRSDFRNSRSRRIVDLK